MAPMTSATPESHDGDSDDRDQDGREGRDGDNDGGDERDDDNDERDDRDDDGRDPDDGSGSGNGIELDSELQPGRTLLNWTVEGPARDVRAFEVYRSIQGGSAQLIDTLGARATSYVDNQYADSGTYTYFVVGLFGSNQQSQSNAHLVLVTCDWVSVSPFGNPPVLLHPECSPIFSSDM